MNIQTNKFHLFSKILTIFILALFPLACIESLDRQAKADYQKCLSWKADGYDVYCDEGEYK